MNEEMKFPKTFEEFIKQYSFFDKQQIYTNGSELIQVFRIKQWEEHKEKENQELKEQLEERTKMYQNAYDYSQKMEGKAIILKTQQNKFIKYLEDEISKLKKEYGNYVYDDYSEEKGKYDTYIEILQKYKEIIGE